MDSDTHPLSPPSHTTQSASFCSALQRGRKDAQDGAAAAQSRPAGDLCGRLLPPSLPPSLSAHPKPSRLERVREGKKGRTGRKERTEPQIACRSRSSLQARLVAAPQSRRSHYRVPRKTDSCKPLHHPRPHPTIIHRWRSLASKHTCNQPARSSASVWGRSGTVERTKVRFQGALTAHASIC